MYYAGGAPGLLFLEEIQTAIVAQASSLWGKRASRLLELFVSSGFEEIGVLQAGCLQATQPGWLCSSVLHWMIHETQAFRLHALVEDAESCAI